MLSFDIRSLESQAVAVDGQLSPADAVWLAGDPLPQSPIRVAGRLSPAGPGRFYFSGRIEGSATGECRRCLTDVQSVVGIDAHLIFAETGLDGEDDAGDASDGYPFDPADRMLDLRPAVREEWLLAAPAFPLCREDCRGLCPQCGADLNADPQHAHATTDPRWETLRDALGGVRGDAPAD